MLYQFQWLVRIYIINYFIEIGQKATIWVAFWTVDQKAKWSENNMCSVHCERIHQMADK